MNNSQPILYELKAGIACLTINRPEALNALSLDVLNQFSRLFDEIRTNESVKADIITGSGKKPFSAGADIKYLSESSPLKVRDFEHKILELSILPNLESTELDIKQQFAFLIKCRNKLREVHKPISDRRGVKKILNNLTVQNDSLLSKECKDSIQIALKELISIEEELYQTKSSSSQDPINFPIKLNDKLAGLMSVAEESESKPSVQSLELYNVLDKSIQNQLTRLSKVFEQTIPEINKMVRNLNIPYIQTKW